MPNLEEIQKVEVADFSSLLIGMLIAPKATSYATPGMTLRTITKDGEPWFMAADACKALDIIKPHQALENLSSLDKQMFNIRLPGRSPWFLNESGLYDLILQSRKPSALEFKHWVTSVVLPAIRKTGGYVMGEGYQRQDYFLEKT